MNINVLVHYDNCHAWCILIMVKVFALYVMHENFTCRSIWPNNKSGYKKLGNMELATV